MGVSVCVLCRFACCLVVVVVIWLLSYGVWLPLQWFISIVVECEFFFWLLFYSCSFVVVPRIRCFIVVVALVGCVLFVVFLI